MLGACALPGQGAFDDQQALATSAQINANLRAQQAQQERERQAADARAMATANADAQRLNDERQAVQASRAAELALETQRQQAEIKDKADREARAKAVAAQEAADCAAQPSCAVRGVLFTLCDLSGRKQAALEMMKEERANPSGYVNISRLHDLGADIQQLDKDIAASATQYRAILGKPFTLGACREDSPRPPADEPGGR